MYAYSGVLTALYERERTGRGSSFDVAMLDALGEWMSQPYYYTVYGGQAARRTGARHASISPYGPYALRRAGVPRPAERPRVGRALRAGAGPARPDQPTSGSAPTRTGWRTTAS